MTLGCLVGVVSTTARAEEPAAPRVAADPLSPMRERVKRGLDRYQEGRYAEAIVEWQSVYAELGPKKGYRLSFNLARAYQGYGDQTRAAERYEAYLREVDGRAQANETLEPIVLKQAAEARQALEEMALIHGRIRVNPSDTPQLVQVDGSEPRVAGFVAYVSPGVHVVTWGIGTEHESKREVSLRPGEWVELSAPVIAKPVVMTREVPPPTEDRRRAFSPWIIVAAAGITAASVAVPVLFYSKALRDRDRYEAAPRAEQPGVASQYEDARTAAYATLAIPIGLGLATGGLAIWYWLGAERRAVPVVSGSAGPETASVIVTHSF